MTRNAMETAFDSAPYMLCLSGRLLCRELHSWHRDAVHLYFTGNPSDPFPKEAPGPREGGWISAPACVSARCASREMVTRGNGA